MVEIYVSWCRGLPENKEALKIIKNSGLIDGIETSEYEDIDKLHSQGVKANIHRPFRDKEFNLEDNSLPEFSEKEIQEYNKSDSPVLGFHLINHKKESEKNKEGIMQNIKDNLEKLDSLFNKKIVFELSPYWTEFVNLKGQENMKYFTGKKVVNDLIANTSAGLLLDVSHVFVSGMNKIKDGFFKGSIEDYFKEILEVSKDRIWQLHINVPIKEETGYIDNHGTFEDNELSEKIINIIGLVLKECKNIKAITLEANTGFSPVEHSKKMVEQIEKLNKKLGIKSIKKPQIFLEKVN